MSAPPWFPFRDTDPSTVRWNRAMLTNAREIASNNGYPEADEALGVILDDLNRACKERGLLTGPPVGSCPTTHTKETTT